MPSTETRNANKLAAHIMALDGRLISFDTEDPVVHLSSLEAIWRSLDTGSAPDTLVLRKLSPCVLIGASQVIKDAIDLDYCRQNHIPVIRRPSEGGLVYCDQGCLVYSLVLSASAWPELSPVRAFERFQDSVVESLRAGGITAEARPPNDIAIKGRKIAGLTITSWYSVYSMSGTLLLDVNPNAIDAVMGRASASELTSVSAKLGRKADSEKIAGQLTGTLAAAFDLKLSDGILSRAEHDMANTLAQVKYGNSNWNTVTSVGAHS